MNKAAFKTSTREMKQRHTCLLARMTILQAVGEVCIVGPSEHKGAALYRPDDA